MKYLSLTIPGYGNMPAPGHIPTGGNATLNTAVQRGIMLILAVAVVYALFILIQGGIQWITSNGEQQKIAAARSRIIYAIVGLVLTFFSFFIINFIGYLFNIKLI